MWIHYCKLSFLKEAKRESRKLFSFSSYLVQEGTDLGSWIGFNFTFYPLFQETANDMLLNSWGKSSWCNVGDSQAPLRISLGRRERFWRIREQKKETAGPLKCQKCFRPFKVIRSFTHLLSHSAFHLHIQFCGLSLVIFNTHATRSGTQSKTLVVSSFCKVDTKKPLPTPAKIYSVYTYQDRDSVPHASSPD